LRADAVDFNILRYLKYHPIKWIYLNFYLRFNFKFSWVCFCVYCVLLLAAAVSVCVCVGVKPENQKLL